MRQTGVQKGILMGKVIKYLEVNMNLFICGHTQKPI